MSRVGAGMRRGAVLLAACGVWVSCEGAGSGGAEGGAPTAPSRPADPNAVVAMQIGDTGDVTMSESLQVGKAIRTNRASLAAGELILNGANGHRNAAMGPLSSNTNLGVMTVNDGAGKMKASVVAASDGMGLVATVGKDSKVNVLLSSVVNKPSQGYVTVIGRSGQKEKAGFYLDDNGHGVGFAHQWIWSTPNPNLEGQDIRYIAAHGAEPVVFLRGEAQLTAGQAEVVLPDHFAVVASQEGLTAQLTPRSAESQGLAAVTVTPERLVVQELGGRKSNDGFYYTVTGLRADHEAFDVLKAHPQAALVPVSDANDR